MSILNLEISEKEYIIKFDKSSCPLSTIQRLINRVQNDHFSFSSQEEDYAGDVRSRIDDHFNGSFDSLSDK